MIFNNDDSNKKSFLTKLEELHIGHEAISINKKMPYQSLLPKTLKRLIWKYNEPLSLSKLPPNMECLCAHNIIFEPLEENQLTNFKTLVVQNYHDIAPIKPTACQKILNFLEYGSTTIHWNLTFYHKI